MASNYFAQLALTPNDRPDTGGLKGQGKPTVIRGRITVPARSVGRFFMFNPGSLTDTKGVTYGSVEVPGASHPTYQFGAGGERLINLELYVDGDRGRFDRQQSRVTSSLSIMDELLWYRSLIYPARYGTEIATVFPYLVLLSYGDLYQGVQCIVKKADWKIDYWTPKLEPVRATISLVLAELPNRSQTSDDILAQAGAGAELDSSLTAYEF